MLIDSLQGGVARDPRPSGVDDLPIPLKERKNDLDTSDIYENRCIGFACEQDFVF